MDKLAEKQDELQEDQASVSQPGDSSNLVKTAEGVIEMSGNPSTGNIMAAITKLHGNVDAKFNNMATSMRDLKNSLEATSRKVCKVEEAVNVHEERIVNLENKYTLLQAKVDSQQKSLDQLESRSRHQNIDSSDSRGL